MFAAHFYYFLPTRRTIWDSSLKMEKKEQLVVNADYPEMILIRWYVIGAFTLTGENLETC